MIQISSLTTDAKQQFNMVVAGYANAIIYMEYKPQQYGWFISISWGAFACNNERMSTGLNLLRQWKNILPFGLLISTSAIGDPLLIDSWTTTHKLWSLDINDMAAIEGYYAG